MKEWFLNLSLREKQTVLAGSFISSLLLLYLLLCVPFANHITTIRDRLNHNRDLLMFMREADQRIQALQQETFITQKNNASLLSLTQDQVKQSTFAAQVTQLRQADHDSVQLSITKVDFDKLIEWLTRIWRNQHLVVAEFSLTTTDTPGIINTEVKLDLGN